MRMPFMPGSQESPAPALWRGSLRGGRRQGDRLQMNGKLSDIGARIAQRLAISGFLEH